MKKHLANRSAMRFGVSVVLGLIIAVAAVASGGVDPNPDPTPDPSPCPTNTPDIGGAIISKQCSSGCPLDPGCCQQWTVERWPSQGGGTYVISWCAGTAYECVTENGHPNRCLDAFGHPALPPNETTTE